jgi:hypothetical protein
MNQFESGKPMKSLLAEYVDGGPGCFRDDCTKTESFKKSLLNSDQSMFEEKTIRCLSCGKSWMEKYLNGARIS